MLTPVGPQRFAVVLLSVFAAVSLLMAALGLYGVISYGVTQRTREIGIRAALGADRKQILAMIIGQGMRMVAVGAAGGLVLALLLGQVVAAQLFEVKSFDPGTFILTALLLAAAASSGYLHSGLARDTRGPHPSAAARIGDGRLSISVLLMFPIVEGISDATPRKNGPPEIPAMSNAPNRPSRFKAFTPLVLPVHVLQVQP